MTLVLALSFAVAIFASACWGAEEGGRRSDYFKTFVVSWAIAASVLAAISGALSV